MGYRYRRAGSDEVRRLNVSLRCADKLFDREESRVTRHTSAEELAMQSVRTTERQGSLGSSWCRAALFFLLLAAASCSSEKPSALFVARPVTLTIGLPVQTGEDPLHGAIQAARLISREGLILPGRDGRVQPRLAESWTKSPDGLTWKFKLRSNAFFHDGSPVTSAAVKASLQRSLASSDIEQFPGLVDIVAIDASSDLEVTITLRESSTFLLDDLGVSILKQSPGAPVIAAGPYVTASAAGNELVMEAFSKYYRGAPKIQRVVWTAYPTVRTAWAAMMRGEIDFLYEIAPEALEFVQPESSVQVFPFLRNYEYAVIFNAKRAPFDNQQVRRALNYAVNRDLLVSGALRGHGRTTSGPTWPLHWAHDSTVPIYAYDPSRSEALLNAARIPAISSVSNSDIAPARFHFTCLLPNTFQLWERMALMVQRDLADIGVDMQLETVPFQEFNRRIAASDFDAVVLEFVVGNTASRPFTFWHSKGKQNVWGFKSPAIDHALDEIRRAPDETHYRTAFRQFQIEALDEAPAIFLALGETSRAVSRRFQVVTPPNSDILSSLADWIPADHLDAVSN
jgi:peptide/nickel transport system substrate-binding protein